MEVLLAIVLIVFAPVSLYLIAWLAYLALVVPMMGVVYLANAPVILFFKACELTGTIKRRGQ